MNLHFLIHLDQQLLLWLNGSDSIFVDQLACILTSGMTWIPLYIVLFYLVIKNNETMSQIGLIVGSAALCVLLADGMADGIMKPLVARWRPSNDPMIKYAVDIVSTRGTNYGFFSAHAANTMALTVFFSMLIRSRWITGILLFWSLINCWTRVYLGLHYPGDILFGILWGSLVGVFVYALYIKIYYKISPHITYISSQYTSTGYDYTDIDTVLTVYFLTFAYVLIRAVMIGF